MSERLFVYATLLEADIQQLVIGRVISGTPALLHDYARVPIFAGSPYWIVEPAQGSRVEGVVLELTPGELEHTDRYETSVYARVQVTLADGSSAWAYVRP